MYFLSQRLKPRNKTHSIERGLQCRVKDPLWLAGMQHSMGEFRAEDGGHLVKATVDYDTLAVDSIVKGAASSSNADAMPFDVNTPLEVTVEEETRNSKNILVSDAWDPKRLEYNFSIRGGDTKLSSQGYLGNDLDWFNFKLENKGHIDGVSHSKVVNLSPVRFNGMPLPRWWSIEDKRVDLGQIKRTNLNYLSMMLLEFSFIYSNDWFVFPLQHTVGDIRELKKLEVIDSFGITSLSEPVIDTQPHKQGWEVFTLSAPAGENSDGKTFYLPNTLYSALQSEAYESVSFLRDEMANLVWAIEKKYQENGEVVNRNDEVLDKGYIDQSAEESSPSLYWDSINQTMVDLSSFSEEHQIGSDFIRPIASYSPKRFPPAHWIPYQPQQINNESGEFNLRRSRTTENTKLPQYKGIILSESTYIREEEITRTGVEINRYYQLALDSNGAVHCWRSRDKKVDTKRALSGMQFDSLDEKS
jgi:hypothetical protein